MSLCNELNRWRSLVGDFEAPCVFQVHVRMSVLSRVVVVSLTNVRLTALD